MKILLICANGMSSSILVDKMKEEAKKQGLDIVIEAKPNSGIHKEKGKWDICLLGPQVRFALKTIEKTLEIPVDLIDSTAYAMADAKQILSIAEKMYEGK